MSEKPVYGVFYGCKYEGCFLDKLFWNYQDARSYALSKMNTELQEDQESHQNLLERYPEHEFIGNTGFTETRPNYFEAEYDACLIQEMVIL